MASWVLLFDTVIWSDFLLRYIFADWTKLIIRPSEICGFDLAKFFLDFATSKLQIYQPQPVANRSSD